ncbi:hypothetical protein [Thalassobellus sediminis]|uniref:hypothetical protein n=1 Tax=Thalassobellus sediminis TaxID=3367753 RepID=UPI0037BAB596
MIITLISCSNNSLKNEIEGQWAIKEITYSGKSYKDQMYTNALIFRENNEISIPETFHFKKDKNATWKVLENKNSITINTSTTVFDDTFDVEFINRTENDPLGIILKSDTIYIKAYKLLDFHH